MTVQSPLSLFLSAFSNTLPQLLEWKMHALFKASETPSSNTGFGEQV